MTLFLLLMLPRLNPDTCIESLWACFLSKLVLIDAYLNDVWFSIIGLSNLFWYEFVPLEIYGLPKSGTDSRQPTSNMRRLAGYLFIAYMCTTTGKMSQPRHDSILCLISLFCVVNFNTTFMKLSLNSCLRLQ